jgi:hypothetical protein
VTPAKRPLDSSGESLADKNGEGGGATSGFTVKRMRIISESESENGSPNKVSQVGVFLLLSIVAKYLHVACRRCKTSEAVTVLAPKPNEFFFL